MSPIEVENGTMEFAGTPGHINVIASDDDDNEAELRLKPGQAVSLAGAIRADQKTDFETDSGVVGWEPGRGIYVEEYGGDDFYLILSPEQQDAVAHALLGVQPL